MMHSLKKTCLIVLLFTVPIAIHAEITTDGSLSPAQNLSLTNGEYAITQDLGRTVGNNLFHSFQTFNIDVGETATFSGNPQIENVISRITGGTASLINGMIQNTLPKANTYLLNPAGILFGEQARLDVQGGFYASTSDYLKFEDGGEFYVDVSKASTFSSAQASAFGFLDNPSGKITVSGPRKVEDTESAGLRVTDGQALSLVASEIEIRNGAYIERVPENDDSQTIKIQLGSLIAPEGHIFLGAVQEKGEIDIHGDQSENMPQLGNISIKESSINVSGDEGEIRMYAGNIKLDKTSLSATTFGIGAGKINLDARNQIDINDSMIDLSRYSDEEAPKMNASLLKITSNNINISGTTIDSSISGDGGGRRGIIELNAEKNININSTYIDITSFDFDFDFGFGFDFDFDGDNDSENTEQKQPGSLSINADNIKLYATFINADSDKKEGGTSITLNANNMIGFYKADSQKPEATEFGNTEETSTIYGGALGQGDGSKISLKSNIIEMTGNTYFGLESFDSGNAGDIEIEANSIKISEGSHILSTASQTGDGGDIEIKAKDILEITGTDEATGYASRLSSSTTGEGHAGNITIHAGELLLINGALIESNSLSSQYGNSGNAGTIDITVSGKTQFSGFNQHGQNENGLSSGIYVTLLGDRDTGNGGHIELTTGSLLLEKGARIESNTYTSGDAGDIAITATNDIQINGYIPEQQQFIPKSSQNTWNNAEKDVNVLFTRFNSGIYSDSGSVNTNTGNAGDIKITAQGLEIFDHGEISTSSLGGRAFDEGTANAGRISIDVEELVLDRSALITSESRLDVSYIFENNEQRDARTLSEGDVLELQINEENGVGYVFIGRNLQRLQPIYQVSSLEALNSLPEESLNYGDIVTVKDSQNSTRHVYVFDYNYTNIAQSIKGKWIPLNEQSPIQEFDSQEAAKEAGFYINDNYASSEERENLDIADIGSRFRIKEGEHFVDYVLVEEKNVDPYSTWFSISPMRISQYQTHTQLQTDSRTLNDLSRLKIDDMSIAVNPDTQEYFIHHTEGSLSYWVKFNPDVAISINNLNDSNAFAIPLPGIRATVGQQEQLYSGSQWININTDHGQVSQLPANPENGDIAALAKENGVYAQQFYSTEDNAWHPMIRGGDAGNIDIKVSGDISLRDNSKISSEAISGGGGKINIDAPDSLVYLNNSEITSSATKLDNDGGQLDLTGDLLIMKNSDAIAKANDGDGGTINITVDEVVQSSGSLISAASRSGADGTVSISASNVNLSKELLVLNEGLLDVSDQVQPACSPSSHQNSQYHPEMHRKAMPDGVDDWQAGGLQVADDEYSRRGQFSRSLKAWLRAYSQAPVEEQMALSRKLASAYQQLAMHQDALKILRTGLALAEQEQVQAEQVLISSQLSDLHLSLGQWEEANRLMTQALQLADAAQNPRLQAYATQAQGNVLVVAYLYPAGVAAFWQQNPENTDVQSHYQAAALVAYEKAMAFAEQADESELQIASQLNALFVKLSLQQSVNALFETTWQSIQNLPNSALKTRQLLSLSVFLETFLKQSPDSNWKQHLFDAYQQAAEIAQQLGNMRGASLAYGRWGRWYQAHGNTSDAQVLMRKAIFFAQHTYNPDILYQWLRTLGQLLAKQGKTVQAVKAYEHSIEILQPIQLFLSTGYRQPIADFDHAVRPVYYELAALHYEQAKAAQGEQQQSFLRAMRDTLEDLKMAELQNVLQDECLLHDSQHSAIESALGDAALIYPVSLEDKLVLLINRDETIQVKEVPVSHAELNNTAKALQHLLALRLHNGFRQPAKALYNWLIQPIEPLLAGADTLIIISDGALRSIPLASLYDGKQFLIEKYALSVAPSLHLSASKSFPWQDSQVLMLGVSDAVQDYPPLPSVPKELQHIERLSPHSFKLLNQDYSIESVQTQLKQTPYSIVHFATHGEFSSSPEHTYLLTHKEKIHMDKLQEILGVGMYREQPIELLTLSACKTAVGDDKAALGLAGVAIKAGAHSALASLWFVDDEATGKTIPQFYKNLSQGMSKAKALQHAQMAMLKQRRYAHPVYWAPFILIGNWL